MFVFKSTILEFFFLFKKKKIKMFCFFTIDRNSLAEDQRPTQSRANQREQTEQPFLPL